MMAKLSKMLMKHASTGELEQQANNVDIMSVVGDFDIPDADGQSLAELSDNVSPAYLRACLETAKKALTGQTSPLDGDFPHRMALLLAHKLTPSRKFGDKPPEETPEQVKKTARALKLLIKSLDNEGEIIMDNESGSSSKA